MNQFVTSNNQKEKNLKSQKHYKIKKIKQILGINNARISNSLSEHFNFLKLRVALGKYHNYFILNRFDFVNFSII